MGTTVSALIVARAGALRDALEALISTVPPINQVEVMDENENIFQKIPLIKPSMIILEANPPDHSKAGCLKALKERFPDIPCILIVEEIYQERSSDFSRADAVILEGSPPEELIGLIQHHLHPVRSD